MTTETLTVVYCTDQTYPFAQTVDGIVGVTVRDSGENYYRYFPAIDRKQPLSGTPSEYTWDVVNQVEYVKSDAAGYINVGTFERNVIAFEYDVSWQDTTYHSMGNGNVYISYYSPTRIAFAPDHDGGNWRTVSTTPAERHTYKLDCYNRNFYLDGEFNRTCGRPSELNVSFFLFSYNSIQEYANKVTVYGAKYWQSDVLVRDFIPVQIGSGEYCLYEKCLTRNVIYRNEGTGTFTGGGTPVPLTYTHTISHTVSLWNGTGYTDGAVKVWNGSQYVDADTIWVWNGSQYVEKAG